MATFVGIHGIGQQYRGKYSLSEAWHSALRDGLAAAGYEDEAEKVSAADVRVMFFGGAFRPDGAMADDDPPYSPEDIKPGPETDLLRTLYEAAMEQDATLGPGAGAMSAGGASVKAMLLQLLRTPIFSGIVQRAFIGNLKQVTRFLADESFKEQVFSCVDTGVDENTRVVIGHSLGSIVAYEYMCRFQPASVRLLLTLGSPLGIPRLVFDRLTPQPVNGKGAWAGTVPTWVNVAAPNDTVALCQQLAGLFPGPQSQTVDDRSVDNGRDAHSIERYLNARQTGSALHEAFT